MKVGLRAKMDGLDPVAELVAYLRAPGRYCREKRERFDTYA